jgi:integrase
MRARRRLSHGTAGSCRPARVEAVRAGWAPRGAALVSVLAYAGLRPQEARELVWRDVREGTLIASAPKTRRRRSVRLLDGLAADLREWRMASGRPGDEAPVFPGRDGATMTADAFSTWRRTEWREALGAAGVAPAVPYVLRHSFASFLAHEGRSLVYIARQLGHSVAVCGETYQHVLDELEHAPRLGAEDAIRAARLGKVAQRLPTGTAT